MLFKNEYNSKKRLITNFWFSNKVLKVWAYQIVRIIYSRLRVDHLMKRINEKN